MSRNLEEVKTDVIEELLFNYVSLLGKICDFDDEYFSFSGATYKSMEEYEIMDIFIDNKKSIDLVDDGSGQFEKDKDYLRLFKRKCDVFISLLCEKLPNNIYFREQFYDIHVDYDSNERFYESCHLVFKLKDEFYI